MSRPTSPNRDLPFRNVTIVRQGEVYRGVAVGRVALLENGSLAKPQQHSAGELPEAERGVTWIDGHHDYDSDEVKALLAAWALADEKAPPLAAPFYAAQAPETTIAERMQAEARFPNVFDDED